jgi:flagellar motor switch protein FliG
LSKFSEIFETQKLLLPGGFSFARRALASAFGEHAAAEHLGSLSTASESSDPQRNAISTVPPSRLALLLGNEHPQTAALLMSRLGVRQAASVLDAFPPEQRPEILYRMATIDQISPEVVERVTSAAARAWNNAIPLVPAFPAPAARELFE